MLAHPDSPGNKRCRANTSHLDIAPTLVSLAGGNPDSESELHGKDITAVLSGPESASPDAIRPGALFHYNMLAFQDGEFMLKVSEYLRNGGDPAKLPEQNWQPDLIKRGAIRSVFDGRYRFSRYFSPLEHHTPGSMEALFKHNDVELFDLRNDPEEVNKFALDRHTYGELLIAMNQKLNELVELEVGEDVGQMLHGDTDANWTLDADITKLRM